MMARLALLIGGLWLLLSAAHVLGAKSRFGVLVVFPEEGQEHVQSVKRICIRYYPELFNLTADVDSAPKYKLKDIDNLSGIETCTKNPQLSDVKGKIPMVTSSNTTENCSIAQQVSVLQSYGAQGVISASSVLVKFNASDYEPASIFAAALYYKASRSELLSLKAAQPESYFVVYGPNEVSRELEGSILVIFCMAVFTVGLGSLWSGYTKHHLRRQRLESLPSSACRRLSNASPGNNSGSNSSDSADQQEDVSAQITPLWVLLFVTLMCSMLLLLYFFFNQLVYFIIAMFVVASAIATYACFEPLIMWTYYKFPRCPTLQLPRTNLLFCIINMELRQFVLLTLSMSLSIVWVVFRNEPWAWVLQDILGILFSINMLKVLRLPSFKICTILLSILFFYDIFFVFITPLLTSDGKSVMVEVATGGSDPTEAGEQLPMVLRVPHLADEPFHACVVPYSLLGFGDILVPGLLLSYCHGFDLLKGTPCKVYWLLSNICYSLALIATFISLLVMDSAQPALLYIVPFTLIPTALLALCRGEFKDFWEGDQLEKELGNSLEPDAVVKRDNEQQQQASNDTGGDSGPAPARGNNQRLADEELGPESDSDECPERESKSAVSSAAPAAATSSTVSVLSDPKMKKQCPSGGSSSLSPKKRSRPSSSAKDDDDVQQLIE